MQHVDKTCLLKIIQVLNYLSIVSLIVAAIVRFTYFGSEEAPSDPFYYLLTFYLFPIAALLVVAEM